MASDPVRLIKEPGNEVLKPTFTLEEMRELIQRSVTAWSEQFKLREVEALREQVAALHRRFDQLEARQRVDRALEEGVQEVLDLLRYNVEHRLGMAIEAKRTRSPKRKGEA